MVVTSAARKPLIILPCRIAPSVADDHLPLPRENSYALSTYVDAIAAAGGYPVMLPILSDPDLHKPLMILADGLLLPGGCDVSPICYNEETRHGECGAVDLRIDALDMLLVKSFLEMRKPIFAICRGMQLVNVALSGTLHQSLPRNLTDLHDGHDRPRDTLLHTLRLDPTSYLGKVLGISVKCNSLHHQGVKALGKCLKAVGHAEEDGGAVVEAFEGVPWAEGEWPQIVGVQCHPEELLKSAPEWQKLFVNFVDACRPRAKLS